MADASVRELIQRAAAATERQLRADTAAMSAAELRGYLRARARCIVRVEVRRMVAAGQVPPSITDDLITAAMERVVHLVAQQLLTPPTVASAVPHVRLRAAA